MKRLVIPIVLSFFATKNSLAVDAFFNVCAVQSDNKGGAFIRTCERFYSKNNCRDGTTDFVYFKADNDGGKNMLSTALAAFSLREKLMLRFSGNSSDCAGKYDITSVVRLYR